jgi:hypothetical protein
MPFLSVRKRLHGTLLLITDGSVLLLTFYNKISGIEVAQENGRCFMSRKQRGCDRFVVGLFFKHPCMDVCEFTHMDITEQMMQLADSRAFF